MGLLIRTKRGGDVEAGAANGQIEVIVTTRRMESLRVIFKSDTQLGR